MKLKLISEVIHMNADQFFGHLGRVKNSALGRPNMPNRTRRYEKKEAKYVNQSPDPKKICQSCEYFSKGACKFVEGKIAPAGVCKFYKPDEKTQSNSNQPDEKTQSNSNQPHDYSVALPRRLATS